MTWNKAFKRTLVDLAGVTMGLLIAVCLAVMVIKPILGLVTLPAAIGCWTVMTKLSSL